MLSLLSVGEHWEAVRAWSEGYGTFEGGRRDHGMIMIMMALLKIMMVVEVKEIMVLLSWRCTL